MAHGDSGRIDPPRRPTLGEEARTLARARIVHGATAAMAARGLSSTVDEVADRAGVSRRTVFRHFATHDELMAAAITECRRRMESRLPGPIVLPGDLSAWLTEVATAVHALNGDIVGDTLWDTPVERSQTTSAVVGALHDMALLRRNHSSEMAISAWSAADNAGTPPPWVIDAFALQFSTFATVTLGAQPPEAGRTSGRILRAVLHTANDEQVRP